MEKAAAERGKGYSISVEKLFISGYKTCAALYSPQKISFMSTAINKRTFTLSALGLKRSKCYSTHLNKLCILCYKTFVACIYKVRLMHIFVLMSLISLHEFRS